MNYNSLVSSGESKPECHSGITIHTETVIWKPQHLQHKKHFTTFSGRGKLSPPCLCLRAGFSLLSAFECRHVNLLHIVSYIIWYWLT